MCSTVIAAVCGQQCQRGKGKPWPISEMIQEIQRRSFSDLYGFANSEHRQEGDMRKWGEDVS